MPKPDLERLNLKVKNIFQEIKHSDAPRNRLRFLDEHESHVPVHSVHYIVQACIYALALYGLYRLFF